MYTIDIASKTLTIILETYATVKVRYNVDEIYSGVGASHIVSLPLKDGVPAEGAYVASIDGVETLLAYSYPEEEPNISWDINGLLSTATISDTTTYSGTINSQSIICSPPAPLVSKSGVNSVNYTPNIYSGSWSVNRKINVTYDQGNGLQVVKNIDETYTHIVYNTNIQDVYDAVSNFISEYIDGCSPCRDSAIFMKVNGYMSLFYGCWNNGFYDKAYEAIVNAGELIGLSEETAEITPLTNGIFSHIDNKNNPHKTNFNNIEGYPEVPIGEVLFDDKTFKQIPQSDWNETDINAPSYIPNKPSNLVSDSNYVHTDNNFTNDDKNSIHTHTNKSIIDSITQLLLDAWNGAVAWITNNGQTLLDHLSSKTNPHETSFSNIKGYPTTPTGKRLNDFGVFVDNPSINGVILEGNKTGAELGLVNAVEGQGLSDNNFTDELLNKLNAAASGGAGSAPLYLSNTNSDVAGYKRLSYAPDAVEVVKTITATNSTVYGETYLFDSPIDVDVIASGQWIFDYWRAVSSASGDSFSRLESFLRHQDGTETTTYFVESPSIENTSIEQRTINYALPQFNMLPTDRFGVRMAFRTTRNAATTYSYIIGGQRGHSITVPIPPRHDYLRDKNDNPDFQHLTNSERFEGGLATGNTILPTVKDVADFVANLVPKPPEEQDLYSYGVIIDTRMASPILQRIGSSDLAKIQPIVNNFKACILKDDATINYYLDSNDVTKKSDGTAANLDGTDGQVMIEIPTMWRKIVELDQYRLEIRFSPYEIVGFEKIEGFYYSPILATVHRPTNKLSSVISTSTDYRGGDNNSSRDALPKTLLGMCATALSRTQFRNYAQNRGIKYIGSTYYMNEVLLQLYWCEYANLNMQDAYIASLTVDGYRQGGLGIGVTTINSTNWNTFNGHYPLIPNGVGFQAVGVNTGIKNYTISGLGVSVDIPVWHGIENLFGHMWQSEDGVNIEIQAADSGALSKAWICKKIRFFADTLTSEYTYIGNIPRTEGYISQMIKGTILPLAVGGSSNTYYCDYSYMTIPATGVSIRQVLRGGAATNGSAAGLGCSNSYNAPSNANANLASRLCCVKSL